MSQHCKIVLFLSYAFVTVSTPDFNVHCTHVIDTKVVDKKRLYKFGR